MNRFQSFLDIVIPLAFGLAAFLAVVGYRALDPTNLALLVDSPDCTVGYLGWHVYRFSDWSFPLGLNPDYGLELGSAILFSDSNPLLAFMFKPFSSLLPVPFQYFGLWLLACFVLQAWFGWLLAGLVTDRPALRIPAMGLFVFAPPMLFRLNAHFNLAGHFLILAALYLTLNPAVRRRRLFWGVLLVTAAMVHAYLLAMAATLWLADLAGRTRHRSVAPGSAVIEFFGITALVGLACWQSGYFSVGAGITEGGYGFFRLNLLSPVDANGWSFLLPDIAGGAGEYEGFNFLGSGVLLLLGASLPVLIRECGGMMAIVRKRFFLAVVLAGLTVFALSHKVGFGPLEFDYPLPGRLVPAANTFRASGRMFWPVFYTVVLGAVFWTVRGWRRSTAAWILAAAFVIQAADTRAGWSGIRRRLMREPSSTLETTIKDPFWAKAASIYSKVRWVPPQNISPRWRDLSVYAATYALATDAVYLARVNRSALKRAQHQAATALNDGRYEADALYVLDDDLVLGAILHNTILKFDAQADVLARIDGFNVLAPGWKKRCDDLPLGSAPQLGDLLPTLESGRRMFLGRDGAGGPFLASGGWSIPEDWGTWSDGPQAEIILPVSHPFHAIRMEAMALVNPEHPRQEVAVRINDREVTTLTLSDPSGNLIEIPVSEATHSDSTVDGVMRIRMIFKDAVRPVDLGINDDRRTLAIGLQAITVY